MDVRGYKHEYISNKNETEQSGEKKRTRSTRNCEKTLPRRSCTHYPNTRTKYIMESPFCTVNFLCWLLLFLIFICGSRSTLYIFMFCLRARRCPRKAYHTHTPTPHPQTHRKSHSDVLSPQRFVHFAREFNLQRIKTEYFKNCYWMCCFGLWLDCFGRMVRVLCRNSGTTINKEPSPHWWWRMSSFILFVNIWPFIFVRRCGCVYDPTLCTPSGTERNGTERDGKQMVHIVIVVICWANFVCDFLRHRWRCIIAIDAIHKYEMSIT